MGIAVVSFLFLPWLDRSPVKSMRYRGPISRIMLALFAVSFIALGYLGLQPAEGLTWCSPGSSRSSISPIFWLMPFYSRPSVDPVKPVPDRVVFNAH